MTRIIKASFADLVTRAKATKGLIKDDHSGAREIRLAGLGRLQVNGREHVVALLNHTVYCLNPVHVDAEDNQVHLSTGSVGGNVDARDVLGDVKVPLEVALELFNREGKDNTFCPQQVVEFELFEPLDEDVLQDQCWELCETLTVKVDKAQRELEALKVNPEDMKREIRTTESVIKRYTALRHAARSVFFLSANRMIESRKVVMQA
jgi:hypothetical protein